MSFGAAALVGLAALAAFLPVLAMPLVTDDYIHIQQIRSGAAPSALGCLTHSCGGPQFFRPIGFAIYRAEWSLWGTAAMPRHALDVLLHVASSLFFLLLARRLGTPPPFDLLAGLLFAWSGTRPELVAWPAARFDTLAVFFSLLASLALLSEFPALSLLATSAACMSKESAFVLPILLAMLAGARKPGWVAANCAVAAVIFGWRWHVLGGIGGYVQQSGTGLAVLQFHPLTVFKTFFFRIWGILWFPLNWERPFEWWMILGMACGIAATLSLSASRPSRLRVGLCMIAAAAACIPVHHMLLIGPSLERVRYLALAMPPFVLALVFAFRAMPRRIALIGLALLVAFHLAAQQHNLAIWRSVALARYEYCRGLAARARASATPIQLSDVPLLKDGVYWRNGIEECLELDFGIEPGKVLINPY